MADFLTALPLFSLALTFCAFQVGAWCQKKTGSALCNPILVGAILVIAVLLITGIDPEVYEKDTQGISWLLTPATVCLALPLYQHIKVLKKDLPAILTGIIAGSLTGLVCIFLLCKLFDLNHELTVSLLPKSITTEPLLIRLSIISSSSNFNGLGPMIFCLIKSVSYFSVFTYFILNSPKLLVLSNQVYQLLLLYYHKSNLI